MRPWQAARGKLSFLPYPDSNLVELRVRQMYTRLRKADGRNVNRVDRIGASAIVPPPNNAPTVSNMANALQPGTKTSRSKIGLGNQK